MIRTQWIAVTALLVLTGCSGKDAEIGGSAGAASAQTGEPAAVHSLSTVHMADPAGETQLLAGFHELEQNAWRWTERKFSVVLKPAADSSNRPQLSFRFAIPPVIIERLKAVTLNASSAGVMIGSESYQKPAEYLFSKALPSGAENGKPVQIDFELDQAIEAGALETRELGVIAISVSVE